jgi:hypothetical protein
MELIDRNAILLEAARIARLPNGKQANFVRLLEHAIRAAEKTSAVRSNRSFSAGTLIKDYFEPLRGSAETLRNTLEKLQGRRLSAGEAARSMAAAHFLVEALRARLGNAGITEPIEHLARSMNLDDVIAAAANASVRAKGWLAKAGRKKGTGSPAFDLFVMALLAPAEKTGGKLTIYKSSYVEDLWAGSLLNVLRQLRPILPRSNFFPAGKLGYSLHNVHRRWGAEKSLKKTLKSRRKKK